MINQVNKTNYRMLYKNNNKKLSAFQFYERISYKKVITDIFTI